VLKVRVIPTLLWKNLGLVKGKGFDSWRPVGTVLPAVKVYNTREVDELILVDISATAENRDLDYFEIESLTSECFVPMTIGGGIRDIEQVKKVLRSGADKVSVNSASYGNLQLIEDIATKFGSQCVVASVDAIAAKKGHECVSLSGKSRTGKKPEDWCVELEKRGAGEILLTSVERDGCMTGYDLDLIKRVAGKVTIPVIASGGAGTYEHLYQAVEAGASAVAAAAMFHFTEQTPLGAKNYLASRGIAVRNSQAKS
jgi:cyclase